MNDLITRNNHSTSPRLSWPSLNPYRQLDFAINEILAGRPTDGVVYEQDSQYIWLLPIAGATDIDITVNGKEVTVRAVSELPVPEGARVIIGGQSTLDVSETVVLPTEVYSDESYAEYKNGYVQITMPRAERTRKIPVSNISFKNQNEN